MSTVCFCYYLGYLIIQMAVLVTTTLPRKQTFPQSYQGFDNNIPRLDMIIKDLTKTLPYSIACQAKILGCITKYATDMWANSAQLLASTITNSETLL